MKSLQLAIPEPCHENWTNMTPTDQGRFCNACSKTVVDFSMMSDYEVLSYFSTVSDERVCGRALPTQLDREMTMPRERKKRLFWYWNYIAMFFLFLSKSNNVKAQGEVQRITQSDKKPTCNVTMGTMVAPKQKSAGVITGKIVGENGLPVPSATIRIQGTTNISTADLNGIYSIKAKEGDVLEFMAVGFDKQLAAVGHDQAVLNLRLVTRPVVVMAGMMVRRIDKSLKYLADQTVNVKVIDKQTSIPVANASMVITKTGAEKADTIATGSNGIYALNKIKDGEIYTVRIFSVGYETASVTIKGSATDPRTMVKEVLLARKAITADANVTPADNWIKPDTRIILRALHPINKGTEALLIVDNVLLPFSYLSTINPNDIQNVNVLKGAAATAIGGYDAENGVIIVTTKKKVLNDSFRVAKAIINKVANAIGISPNANKINLYPNPVRSGRAFIVSMNFQQTGEMEMQIADINGRIVMQKQITTSSKDHLEKIEADSRWPAGMYFLNVYNSNGGQQGKLSSAVSFVVQ